MRWQTYRGRVRGPGWVRPGGDKLRPISPGSDPLGDLVAKVTSRIRAREAMGCDELQELAYNINTGTAHIQPARVPGPGLGQHTARLLVPSLTLAEMAFFRDCLPCCSCWCLDTLLHRIQASLWVHLTNWNLVRWQEGTAFSMVRMVTSKLMRKL